MRERSQRHECETALRMYTCMAVNRWPILRNTFAALTVRQVALHLVNFGVYLGGAGTEIQKRTLRCQFK
jgi:hypothetical protein